MNELLKYKNILKERNTLLKENSIDLVYLETLEERLCEPQYKIIKLDAKYILSCEKKAVPKAKGTGVVEYYNVPEPNGGLLDWLLLTHGNNGLVAVGDNILFHKIIFVKFVEK